MRLSICALLVIAVCIVAIFTDAAEGRSSRRRNHNHHHSEESESIEESEYRPRGRGQRRQSQKQQQGRRAGITGRTIKRRQGSRQQGRGGLLAGVADAVTGVVSGILGTNRGYPYHGGFGGAPASYNPYNGYNGYSGYNNPNNPYSVPYAIPQVGLPPIQSTYTGPYQG